MNNFTNNVSFLRTSRQFPADLAQLAIQVGRSYIDIATAVNTRIVGIFSTNLPIVTGESWYVANNQKQQTLRKLYVFGTIAAGTELDIPVNIPADFIQFTKIFGSVITNVPDYRPLPYPDPVTNTNGMTILVGLVGGVLSIRIIVGATAPNVVSGLAVLEYLSNV